MHIHYIGGDEEQHKKNEQKLHGDHGIKDDLNQILAFPIEEVIPRLQFDVDKIVEIHMSDTSIADDDRTIFINAVKDYVTQYVEENLNDKDEHFRGYFFGPGSFYKCFVSDVDAKVAIYKAQREDEFHPAPDLRPTVEVYEGILKDSFEYITKDIVRVYKEKHPVKIEIDEIDIGLS